MLNDDCIYKILEWLSLDDLCLCSRTCKRLHALSDNHFRRKYPTETNDEVAIQILGDGKLRYEKYVKYFDNFIKRLNIRAGNSAHHFKHVRVVRFMRAKCDPNFRQICIDGYLELDPFYKDISRFLRNVEVVQFFNREISGRDELTLLEHCPNLSTISLDTVCTKPNVNAILGRKYPKLKQLRWINASVYPLQGEKLKIFFRNNDNIQCMEWSFGYNWLDVNLFLECIESVVKFALNLEHLFLVMNKELAGRFEQICGYLKVLRAGNNFKSLHLKVDGCTKMDAVLSLHAHQLADFRLASLTKIHIISEIHFMDLVRALRPYAHLKRIVLRLLDYAGYWLQWSSVIELMDLVDKRPIHGLPQIEQIDLHEDVKNGRNNEKQIVAYLMLFARHWVNLKNVSVHTYRRSPFKETYPVNELNWARTKLTNACELTIFTDREANVMNSDHRLVKLRCVKFESQSFNEKLFLKNCSFSIE